MMRAFAGVIAACAVATGCANTAEEDTVDRNLSGVWQVMNTANYNLEAHPAKAAMQMREGPVVPVPAAEVLALGAVGSVPAGPSMLKGGGNIPYTEEALAIRNQNAANWIDRDPEIKCYLPGVPRATYQGMPFRIMQSEEQMLIIYEYANAVRKVFYEDPGEAPVDSWMGQSYGYWDGDTFVIEVTAQNGQSWLDRAGNYLSPFAKVTERYTKTSPYHINYEATIEDPDTYAEPWTIEMTLYKKIGDEATLHEFNCVEFVEELMYGPLRKEPLSRQIEE